MKVPRLEGEMDLDRDFDGRYRVSGGGRWGFEARMAGRSPLDAVHLSQRICAHSGVTHALAAVAAWEAVGELEVPENGRLGRELIHLLSFLQAHLHQFYHQILPDYLPLSALGGYGGPLAAMVRTGRGIAAREGLTWSGAPFAHRFSDKERDALAEHLVEAGRAMEIVQRMIAALGGKYPVVMSVVPGGLSVRPTPALMLRLESLLARIEPFVSETVLEDGLVLLERHPEIREMGQGISRFISMGSVGPIHDLGVGLFPEGMVAGDRLRTLGAPITESIRHAYYRIAPGGTGGTAILEDAPGKPEGYTWIKAPRFDGKPAETGPVARLIVAQSAGAHGRAAGMAALLEDHLERPLVEANTVGGRVLALLAEMGVIARRCDEVIRRIDPDEPAIEPAGGAASLTGEGEAALEAPAGSLRHRIVMEDGKIVHYDVIAPSTWNGSPLDENGESGSIEVALRETAGYGDPKEARLRASRIVHSFAFSAADAVH